MPAREALTMIGCSLTSFATAALFAGKPALWFAGIWS
jgi:hypothetical protein